MHFRHPLDHSLHPIIKYTPTASVTLPYEVQMGLVPCTDMTLLKPFRLQCPLH